MPPQDSKSNLVSGGQLITLLLGALLGAGLLAKNQSSPRSVTEEGLNQEENKQDQGTRTSLPLRLWQDPLAGLDLARPSLATNENLKKMVESGTATIIFDHVPKNNEPSSVETRRRERQAIMAALSKNNYVPLNQVFMQHYVLEEPAKNGAKVATRCFFPWLSPRTQDAKPLIYPYEWYRKVPGKKGDDSAKFVLLFWLHDEDASYHISLGRIPILYDELRKQLAGHVRISEKAVTGPAGTSVVRSFIGLMDKNEDFRSKIINEIKPKIYITQSTEDSVRRDPIFLNDSLFSNTSWRLRGNVHFTIGTDALLAERIVSELDSRDLAWWGPWLSDGPNSKVQVLLLSEGDTEYSRGLRTVFRDAFERKLGGNKYVVAEAAYLQGLDGKLPAIDKKTNPNPKGDDRKSQETITAEGNRQQDYWLRYADILTRNGVRYRAIGILGSDPYDKLTLLKALRSAYPDALFFTNDLDARLAQPEFLPWTNGLIIATHYGLALNEQLQEGIPPFRSSYQTSSYLACMHLLSNLEANKADWSPLVNLEIEQLKVALQRNNWPNDWHEVAFKHARVYEMGRNGPIALESGETQVQSVHPAPAASPPPGKIDVLFFVVFLLILSVLLWMTSRDFRGKCIALFSIFKKRPFISWGSLVAGLVLIAALVVGYLIDPIKEPWSLTDGISIWPTIVLRIGAVTVGLFLMRRAYCKLKERRRSLVSEYIAGNPKEAGDQDDPQEFARFLAAKADSPQLVMYWAYDKTAKFSSKVIKMLKYFAIWPDRPQHDDLGVDERNHRKSLKDSDHVIIDRLSQALCLASVHWRFLRMVMLFALFFVLALILVILLGFPRSPSRGQFAFWTGFITFLLAEPVVLLLMILYIYDVTMLSYRFLHWMNVNSDRLVWPKHLFPQDYFPTDVRLAGKSLVFNRELAQKIYEQFFKVRLAADATVDIATILPYPFIMLAILFISQTPIFDDWRWSMTQIIIMGLSLSAILASAFFLQRVASSIRKHALKTLDRLVLFPGKAVAAGANVPIAPSIRALAEYVRNRIESVDSGAYRPFSKSPIVSAILIPATSIGASYGAPELLRWFSNWL